MPGDMKHTNKYEQHIVLEAKCFCARLIVGAEFEDHIWDNIEIDVSLGISCRSSKFSPNAPCPLN